MNILRSYFVALGLFLAAAPVNGFVPYLKEGPQSEVLAKLGFAVSFKKALGAGDSNEYLWIAEISFADQEAAKEYSGFRVRIADAGDNVLFESDHTPGEYTAYTSPSFGRGGRGVDERRFGFRVYVRAKNLPFTRIEFSGEKGIHTVPLNEFFLQAKKSEPLLSASSRRQESTPETAVVEPSVPRATDASAAGVDGNYRLSPNEVVRVTVLQEDDLETTARIAQDGTIMLPLIRSVQIGGKSLREAAAIIEAALREHHVVRPQVTITLTEFSKRRFAIIGAVDKPGTYEIPANESLDLIQAVALAGGYRGGASPSGIIVKRRAEGGERVLKVDGKKMARDTTEKAFRILPGDIISVPESTF